jgi:hypothetical protein
MNTVEWLICAFYKDENDLPRLHSIETALLRDVNKIRSALTLKPPMPKLTVKGIALDRLPPWRRGDDNHVVLSIVTHFINAFTQRMTYRYGALITDRDLFVEYGLIDWFEPLAKSNYFDHRNYPERFFCCFGDTPSQGMCCTETSDQLCAKYTSAGCAACQSGIGLLTCKHTCYWHLVGLMLGLGEGRRTGGGKKKQAGEIKETNALIKQLLHPSHQTPYIY